MTTTTSPATFAPWAHWSNRNRELCSATDCAEPIAGWSVMLLTDRQVAAVQADDTADVSMIGYCAADLRDIDGRPEAGRWHGVRAVGVVWLTREGPRVR